MLFLHLGPIFSLWWQQASPFLRVSHPPLVLQHRLCCLGHTRRKQKPELWTDVLFPAKSQLSYSIPKELPIPPFQMLTQTSFPPFPIPAIFLWSSFDPNGALNMRLLSMNPVKIWNVLSICSWFWYLRYIWYMSNRVNVLCLPYQMDYFCQHFEGVPGEGYCYCCLDSCVWRCLLIVSPHLRS